MVAVVTVALRTLQQLRLCLHPLPSSHVFEATEAARASSKAVPLATGACQGAGRPPPILATPLS